ncbi:MAG: tRNA (N6-threonylcarbamoyladenosine(37)-N6)-methyltransferase TrmO [Ruminococcaceae bacterium]|nr:tRNA (N6-threonylcarbamoyladenosine(37)-N6)-methyltransferase TrmO [Oscillospiraceae bacterium]
MEIKPIGYIRTAFPTKFGLPRQSGLCKSIEATLVFEPEFRVPEALKGLEKYSHVWIIWGFSENKAEKFSPTVRPPRLGGNTRMGVFATRSSFRPNSLALSCLKLEKIEKTENCGHVLRLLGADMMDGTPVYDIKPYLPHVDSVPNALGGFSTEIDDYTKDVIISKKLEEKLTPQLLLCLREALSQDPRPSYIDDEDRIFGFLFDKYEVKFKVEGKTLTVLEIEEL